MRTTTQTVVRTRTMARCSGNKPMLQGSSDLNEKLRYEDIIYQHLRNETLSLESNVGVDYKAPFLPWDCETSVFVGI